MNIKGTISKERVVHHSASTMLVIIVDSGSRLDAKDYNKNILHIGMNRFTLTEDLLPYG